MGGVVEKGNLKIRNRYDQGGCDRDGVGVQYWYDD